MADTFDFLFTVNPLIDVLFSKLKKEIGDTIATVENVPIFKNLRLSNFDMASRVDLVNIANFKR